MEQSLEFTGHEEEREEKKPRIEDKLFLKLVCEPEFIYFDEIDAGFYTAAVGE